MKKRQGEGFRQKLIPQILLETNLSFPRMWKLNLKAQIMLYIFVKFGAIYLNLTDQVQKIMNEEFQLVLHIITQTKIKVR